MQHPIILALDTATDACSVALCTHNQTFNKFVVEPQAHSKLLLGMIDELLQQADLSLKNVDAFAFGRGPGSFTGVRIAASVVQGLALGVNKPVIAVSSLQALAQQAANKHETLNILPMLDARMHEIYWGFYKVNKLRLVETKSADSLQKPESLIVDASLVYLAVGTGATTYANILSEHNPKLQFDHTIQFPRAEEILQLALEQFKRGETIPPNEAIPTYVRNNVAQVKAAPKKNDVGKKNPDLGSRD